MKGYRAKGGVEVTDEMIDQWNRDADNGFYHGTSGKLMSIKPLGHPPLYEEPMVPVTFCMPGSEAEALRKAADKRGVSFADLMREACHKELGRQTA